MVRRYMNLLHNLLLNITTLDKFKSQECGYKTNGKVSIAIVLEYVIGDRPSLFKKEEQVRWVWTQL